jgi:hypothetical protein
MRCESAVHALTLGYFLPSACQARSLCETVSAQAQRCGIHESVGLILWPWRQRSKFFCYIENREVGGGEDTSRHGEICVGFK